MGLLVQVHQALRFRGVQPQTFHTNGEVALVANRVINFLRVHAPCIIPVVVALVGVSQNHSRRFERLKELRLVVHLAPDRDHQLQVHLVQLLHHVGRIWVGLWIPFRTPSQFAPIEPVLHDGIQGNTSAPELLRSLQQLSLASIVLPALPESIGELSIERSSPSDLPVASNDSIHTGTIDIIIVNGLSVLRLQSGQPMFRSLDIDPRARNVEAEVDDVLSPGLDIGEAASHGRRMILLIPGPLDDGLCAAHTLGSDDGFMSSSKGRNFGIIHQPANMEEIVTICSGLKFNFPTLSFLSNGLD
mmetsp:Transcript_42186/g.91573  ORF Transcript_42186/g.91573 Transcript_42186/m.91573 type:complete len:302 (-) Transcript_42186:45-950(-)